MHIEGEPVVALCYIKKAGDTRNVCYLTRENLFVRFKNKLTTFSNNNILGITFEHKILLLPLITGGIITPLSIHALLHSYTNPWLLLSLMIIGLILMYFGWEGSSTITVKNSVKDYDFFIKQPTANLRAFAEFVQHYISADEKGRMFYFSKTTAEWVLLKAQEFMTIDEPLILKNWREINEQNHATENVILGIDPIASDIEVKFVQNAEKVLQPTITQDLPVRYIHEVKN